VVTNRETINKSVHLKELVNLKMVGHIRAVQFGNIKITNLQSIDKTRLFLNYVYHTYNIMHFL